ncbi:MAG: hypothetical protein CMB80_18025 [Flammeovirgaceae bacterium]|nr:hypothetical protein [Flammeovirgaceae bacterium]|tara:strand:- start:332 stop:928 length:597 start_codon:yes stop_codon:yes gene_type:complete
MSPRSKQQFEEIREASQRKIFDASLELFGTKGYEATSISQIAKIAGISKGLIYNYFESKEALLEAMILDLVSIGDEMVEQMWSDQPEQTLKNLIQAIFVWFRQNDKLNRLLIGLSTQIDRFQFVHDMAQNKMEGYLVMLENLLKEIGFSDYKTEARILATLFDGIALHIMMMKEDYPMEEVEQMLINKYCVKQSNQTT